jgi:hypothetical protein
MNSEHTNSRVHRSGGIRCYWVFIAIAFGMVTMSNQKISWAARSSLECGAQSASTSIDSDFSATVAAMADLDPLDTVALERTEKQALGILDGIVMSTLAGNGRPDLDSLNSRLSKLGVHEHSFGESYRVLGLGGKPLAFALVADFGLGAPSAIRLYSVEGGTGQLVLSGGIDRFTQKDMLDDSLELLPVSLPESAPEVVFVIVGGRTDELQTGIFTAWRFEGRQLKRLWTSDLITHSTSEMSGRNFVLTYCHDPADQDSKMCRSMVREKFAYSVPDGEWKKLSSEPISNSKH